MKLALQVTVLAIIGVAASAHELRGSPLSAAEVNRRDEKDARQRARKNGTIKRSGSTPTGDKASASTKRAANRAENQGRITRKERDNGNKCIEKGGRYCNRNRNKNRDDNRDRNRNKNRKNYSNNNKNYKNCTQKKRDKGKCSYSELFAGLHSEDVELMEDYFERFDEEELEFIANFLLGADHEDDEEYYY